MFLATFPTMFADPLSSLFPSLTGTKVNWTASLKPPPQVRAEWASKPHGLTALGPDSAAFNASLAAVCTRLGVCTGTQRSAANAKLEQGLSALGLHVEEYPRNCLSKTCTAYCNLGCRSGHKQSSEVWLVDAVRAGAHVLTGVQAQCVLTTPCQVGARRAGLQRVGGCAKGWVRGGSCALWMLHLWWWRKWHRHKGLTAFW